MLNISIKTIPHTEQRYATCGDYFRDDHKRYIRVSDMHNRDYEFLVALHEMIEYYLVEKRKITVEEIDKFDIEYEKNRQPGDVSEPGNSKKAPYYREHQFATAVERLMATELGIDWNDYDQTVSEL